MQGVGPEYVIVNNRVSENYHKRYKDSLVKMHDSNMVDLEHESNKHMAKLSLRPSVFKMLEQVLNVSEYEAE